MREGGLDAEFLSVFVPPKLFAGEKAYAQSLLEFDAIDALVAANSSVVVSRAHGEGRSRSGRGGEDDISDRGRRRSLARGRYGRGARRSPPAFYDRGARYMTLTWSNSNRLGGSSGDEGRGRGLTPFGRRVVAAMNDLGMMVDISHVSDATFFDAVAASRLPVIASHSSSRALADRPRNMTDDMLRAVRDNGGAVCVNFGPEFLDAEWAKKWTTSKRPWTSTPPLGRAEPIRKGAAGRMAQIQSARSVPPPGAGDARRRPHRAHGAGRRDRPRLPGKRLRRRPEHTCGSRRRIRCRFHARASEARFSGGGHPEDPRRERPQGPRGEREQALNPSWRGLLSPASGPFEQEVPREPAHRFTTLPRGESAGEPNPEAHRQLERDGPRKALALDREVTLLGRFPSVAREESGPVRPART